MKNKLTFQLSAVANWKINEQDPFPGIVMVNSISGYENRFFPARTSFGPVAPVKKIFGREAGLNLVSDIPLRQVAARLSEIELALDCYNVSALQFSTKGLKDLFQDKRMPAICKLAAQMEEMAGENRFQEVKDLLREIKKKS